MPEYAYHFTGPTLRDGSPLPAVGEWEVYAGPVVMCESGLHASRHPFEALQYAPGSNLRLVEVEQIVSEQIDKLVCRRRRTIKQFDAGPVLHEFARWCASQVLHLWDAPSIVREYLATGDESLRDDAWAAAETTVRAAARAAALATAVATTWDAAWATSRATERAAALAAYWAATQTAAREAEAPAEPAALAASNAANAQAAARADQRAKFQKLAIAAFAKIGDDNAHS